MEGENDEAADRHAMDDLSYQAEIAMQEGRSDDARRLLSSIAERGYAGVGFDSIDGSKVGMTSDFDPAAASSSSSFGHGQGGGGQVPQLNMHGQQQQAGLPSFFTRPLFTVNGVEEGHTVQAVDDGDGGVCIVETDGTSHPVIWHTEPPLIENKSPYFQVIDVQPPTSDEGMYCSPSTVCPQLTAPYP